MNDEEALRILIEACSYKPGWEVMLKASADRFYIQIKNHNGVCAVSGKPMPWVSGKRYLSPWMCSQEVVGAVFALIKDAELHEVHEWFRYRGRSIYNPHLDPDSLAELASSQDNFTTRPDSMQRA